MLPPAPFPRPPTGASPAAVWSWHLFVWSQNKLCRRRKKDLRAVLETTQRIVDLLRDPTIVPPSIDVCIDEQDFAKSMLGGSMQYFVLSEFAKVVHADYYLERPTPVVGDMGPLVLRILSSLSVMVDPRSFYFPISQGQYDFEYLLFSDKFPFADMRDDILSGFSERPRRDLTERILAFYTQANTVFAIREGAKASTCILLLFRIIFEHAYAANPMWFYPNRLLGLQALNRSLLVTDLDIDPKFLNGHNQSATVYDAFGGDPVFVQCAGQFEAAAMHTNPFDALNEIARLIGCIEQHATERHTGGLLSFEVTFGFFIGAMLISAVPSFEEVAAFIADFAPSSGLCPAFEFAAATTAADGRYCATLRERLSRDARSINLSNS
jgi:hypothetical protein